MNTNMLKGCFVSVLLIVSLPATADQGHNRSVSSPYKHLIDVPGGVANQEQMPKIELPPGCDPTKRDVKNNPCFTQPTKTPQRSSVFSSPLTRSVP